MRIDKWAFLAFVAAAMMVTDSDLNNNDRVVSMHVMGFSLQQQTPATTTTTITRATTVSTQRGGGNGRHLINNRGRRNSNDCPQNSVDSRNPILKLGFPLQMAAEEYVSLDDVATPTPTPPTPPPNKKKRNGKQLTPSEQKRLELQQAIKDAESKRVDALNLEDKTQERIEELEQQIRLKKERLEEFEAEERRQAELKRSLTTNVASGAVAGLSSTVAAVGSLVAARSFLERRRTKIEEDRQRLADELKKKEELLAKTTLANKKTYSLLVSNHSMITVLRIALLSVNTSMCVCMSACVCMSDSVAMSSYRLFQLLSHSLPSSCHRLRRLL